MTTNTNRVEGWNVLGEVDRRVGVFQLAEDRASFWHELFVVQSIEEYELFLWLEADVEELQGDAAQAARVLEVEERLCDAHQEEALVHYARVALFRAGIVSLLPLDYRPFLPAWIDELGDRWHGPQVQQEGEAIYPDMDEQALENFANRETLEGNVSFYQLRHPYSPAKPKLCDQALQHYKAAARARRRLIGGWLLQYAAGRPRMILDEVDLAELSRLKRRLEEVRANIARIAPQARDPYVDGVGQMFHLGWWAVAAIHERSMSGRWPR